MAGVSSGYRVSTPERQRCSRAGAAEPQVAIRGLCDGTDLGQAGKPVKLVPVETVEGIISSDPDTGFAVLKHGTKRRIG